MASTLSDIPVIHVFDPKQCPRGTVGKYWLSVASDGFGELINIPLMVARGKNDGPVVGITAAIHGNELNGIPVIQRLFRDIDPDRLHGTIVGALTLNVPGLMLGQRQFNDGIDLNRIAPGRPDGNRSEIYIHRLVERLLPPIDYLIDLHTASAGRINSWYIRADMDRPATARMARLQNPDIILNNAAGDGTFRGTASSMGIDAITLELRDPHVFQKDVIADALQGVWRVLADLDMIERPHGYSVEQTVMCPDSYWMYCDDGGILTIRAQLGASLRAGEVIAELSDVFGRLKKTYQAEEDGIVIGKSVDPIAQTGSRILHLGRSPVVLAESNTGEALGQM